MSDSCYVLIVMQPEPGHIMPTIPVAAGLQKHGHRVVYLTSSELSRYLRLRGFETETFGVEPHQEKEQGYNTGYSILQSGRSYWRTLDSGRMQTFLRDRISQVAKQYSAALVLVDHLFYRNYKLLSSGKVDDTPVVHLSTSLPRFDEPRIHSAVKRWVLCPAAFELPCFLTQHSNALYGEPSIDWDRPELPLSMDKRRQGAPLIVYSAGTQIMMHVNADGRLRELIAAAEHLSDCDFVIAYSYGQTGRVDSIPDNVTMAPHIPQLQILRQTAALISHCGLGSLKEAFCCGVPVLGMPMVFDQPYNAMRVRKQHLGVALYPSAVSAHNIRDGILDILGDRTISTAVQTLREQFLEKEAERPFLKTLLQLLP